MSAFVKPPWADDAGWDERVKRQTIEVGSATTVGLTLGEGEPPLSVNSSNPAVARVDEKQLQAGMRIFRVTGRAVASGGIALSTLEAKDASGTLRASLQIEVRGPAGKKTIAVSLAKQLVRALEGATKQFEFECVTGASDQPTAPGIYCILRKDRIHRSARYNEQMNFAMFFSTDGRAIHQYHGLAPFALVRTHKGDVADGFGAHGCVRLCESDARALFDWAPIGTTVEVR